MTDQPSLLRRLAGAAVGGLRLLAVGLAALALAIVAAAATVIGAAARLVAAMLGELARLVQAALPWLLGLAPWLARAAVAGAACYAVVVTWPGVFLAYRADVPALLAEVARLRAMLAGKEIMLLAGTTVYNIVTDHPNYSHDVFEGGRNYGVYADRAVAERIAAAWNSYHADTNTPNPWPFYVLECIVKSPSDAEPAADDDDSLQLVLF